MGSDRCALKQGVEEVNILILDDDEVRHETFAARYAGHNVVHAFRYSTFVKHLEEYSPWNLIHLDHDLGDFEQGDTYVDGWGNIREFNGRHAAQKICELPDELLPDEVVIQSINPEGAKSMRSLLLGRGVQTSWIPFDPFES